MLLRLATVVVCCAVLLANCGCRISQENLIRKIAVISNLGNDSVVEVTPTASKNPLNPIKAYLAGPKPPSERTVRLLRTYSLEKRFESDPDQVIEWLQELVEDSPSLEEVHALAEICKLQADWQSVSGNDEAAAGLYASAMIHAHQFLFDSDLNLKRNAYDPQFRSICDVYNKSLESILRSMCSHAILEPDTDIVLGDESIGCQISIQFEGRWKLHNFERFELVSDYKTSGIENQYRTYGLGVPLIGVCKTQQSGSREGKYYPPSLTLPLTAFFELVDTHDPDAATPHDQFTSHAHPKAVIKLYDPLETTFVEHHDVTVPLESDLTTPLAYHLNDPLLNSGLLATATLINGELADGIHGMYMLSPFDPNKIPVVMVHGIWSSPVTWAHMFNDLRAIQEIHENYQFWFYAYPTGQPFWISAQQMREDLQQIRRELDPGTDSKALDEMILIGHSMGGLVSQLQVIDSGNRFWQELVSDSPFGDLEGDSASIQQLRDTFFFRANPGVDHVITIGTPNRGSASANATTRWVGQKLFTLPSIFGDGFSKLVRENPDILGDGTLLTTTTSVDSLSPDCPIFEVMETAGRPSSIRFHNVIGQIPKRGFIRRSSEPGDGDGVVSVESAKSRFAESEIILNAEHSKIHQHPGCILEVRKILTENLVQKNRIRSRRFPDVPMTWEAKAPEESMTR